MCASLFSLHFSGDFFKMTFGIFITNQNIHTFSAVLRTFFFIFFINCSCSLFMYAIFIQARIENEQQQQQVDVHAQIFQMVIYVQFTFNFVS